MQCPKCSGEMQPIQVGEIEVDRCAACHGIWFDLREHERLRDVPESEARIDTPPSPRAEELDSLRNLTCPRCSGKLVTLAVRDQPHIRYEQCHTCGGSFFDAGEFSDYKNLSFVERVLRAIPGLRRSG